MTRVDITIKVSGSAKQIPILILEHLDFKRPFRFKDGEWVKHFSKFPIDSDNILDYALAAAGIPNTECKVTLTVKAGAKSFSKESTEPFGQKGWAIVKENLPLT
ncbi:MAG: hypothetical protein NXI00_19100 [Cytophagales bacterium]|nr:hypothetical protein [Cytophagales bacterium]